MGRGVGGGQNTKQGPGGSWSLTEYKDLNRGLAGPPLCAVHLREHEPMRCPNPGLQVKAPFRLCSNPRASLPTYIPHLTEDCKTEDRRTTTSGAAWCHSGVQPPLYYTLPTSSTARLRELEAPGLDCCAGRQLAAFPPVWPFQFCFYRAWLCVFGRQRSRSSDASTNFKTSEQIRAQARTNPSTKKALLKWNDPKLEHNT